jgi:3-ketoacyl-CoA synthase
VYSFLVLAAEGFYTGNKPESVLSDILFGMGAAAVLLTNRPAMVKVAKYQLLHSETVNIGADDVAYRSMGRFGETSSGIAALAFNTDVPASAQKAIQAVVKKVASQTFFISNPVWGLLLRTVL